MRDSKSYLFALESNKKNKLILWCKILLALWLYPFSVGAGESRIKPDWSLTFIRPPSDDSTLPKLVHSTDDARSNVQTALTGGPRREGRWGVSEMCKFLRTVPPPAIGLSRGRQRIPSVRGTGQRPSLTEDEFHPLGRCCGALLPQWVTGPAVGTGGCIGQGGTGFAEGEGDLSPSEKRTWGFFGRGVKRVRLCEELNPLGLIFAISCDTVLQERPPRLSVYTTRYGILGLAL